MGAAGIFFMFCVSPIWKPENFGFQVEIPTGILKLFWISAGNCGGSGAYLGAWYNFIILTLMFYSAFEWIMSLTVVGWGPKCGVISTKYVITKHVINMFFIPGMLRVTSWGSLCIKFNVLL